jgi:hypothetical protein
VRVHETDEVIELLKGEGDIVLTRQLYWRCTAMLGSRLSAEKLAVV